MSAREREDNIKCVYRREYMDVTMLHTRPGATVTVYVLLGARESAVRLDPRVRSRTVTCEPGAAGRIAGRIAGIPGNPGILGQPRDISPTRSLTLQTLDSSDPIVVPR